jgi:hypothetical protein
MSKLRVTKTLVTLALALILCGALVMSVQATNLPELDFNIRAIIGGAATIGYGGGANPLVGANIPVFTITGLGTPLNNGVSLNLDLSGSPSAFLGFTTGNFMTSNPEEWQFGPGGTISIIGSIAAQTPTGGSAFAGLGASTTLLSGHFTGTEDVDALGSNFYIAGASFLDSKDATLLAYFGLTGGNALVGNYNISFNASSQTPPSSFYSTQVLSGDVINAVPIPPSALLLGSGLLALAGLGWRRKKA